MAQENFDVVIVGGGISGALIASKLARANKKVLILEAGVNNGLTEATYDEYLQRFYTQAAKVPNSPYANNPYAPQPNVLDISRPTATNPDTSGYFVQYGPLPFTSSNTRSLGGTTLHWLGVCLRMLPNDFKMLSTYGYGVDWPIDYWDLKPFYEEAELEIGVSADVEDLHYPGTDENFFGNFQYPRGYPQKGTKNKGKYIFPMHRIPPTYLDQYLAKGLKGMKFRDGEEQIPIDVVSIPQGRNSNPNYNYHDPRTGFRYRPQGAAGQDHKGERCEGNSSCIPICPVQAKYSALKTLHNVLNIKHSPVTLQAQSVVSKLNIDPDTGKITGVVYKEYVKPGDSEGVKEKVAQGKLYILAGSAIENAKMMLASGAGRSSNQLGANLMDHPYLLTWGLAPDPVGPFRGPFTSSGIPSFRDGKFRNRHSAFRTDIGNWGWNFPTGAPWTDVENMVDQQNLFGKRLRKALYNRIQSQFRFGFLIEQLPQSTNRITIDPSYVDSLGNYRPVIYYNLSEYERAGMACAKAFSDQVMQRLGAADYTTYSPADPGYLEYQGMGFTYHGSGHIVGTHRMGTNKFDSVVNKHQQSWDHKNLYVVGCGSMSTIGTSNPTLTMAALALQAAGQILKQLR
ncbi:MAG: GMC family oxidoreductase [Saprospiraceae bacterium]|nr:GMC family oxidoreductase [Saprospiraceae bacterium]